MALSKQQHATSASKAEYYVSSQCRPETRMFGRILQTERTSIIDIRTMQQPDRMFVSYQAEYFRRRARYRWMIYRVQNPDKPISWGYSSTQDLAEATARQELADLSSASN